MSGTEVFFIGIALSMDAFAVGMANGMAEPRMSAGKWFAIAFAFALFQFAMPLLGYACGAAFSDLVGRIAPWLSFGVLAVLGGKSVFGFIGERLSRKERQYKPMLVATARGGLTLGKLLVQALATSFDALAVGVTLLAAETSSGLPFPVAECTLIIGAVTFGLSSVAVWLGRKAGCRFSEEAELIGGVVLIAVGLKILLEAVL